MIHLDFGDIITGSPFFLLKCNKMQRNNAYGKNNKKLQMGFCNEM